MEPIASQWSLGFVDRLSTGVDQLYHLENSTNTHTRKLKSAQDKFDANYATLLSGPQVEHDEEEVNEVERKAKIL